MGTTLQSVGAPSPDPLIMALVDDWRNGKRPVHLKVDDRLPAEIKDETSFRMMLDLLDRLQNIAAIQKGLDDFEAGRSGTINEFKQRAHEKHGITN